MLAAGGAKDGLSTVTGSPQKGYVATLTLGIDPDAEDKGGGGGAPGGGPGGKPPPGGPPSG